MEVPAGSAAADAEYDARVTATREPSEHVHKLRLADPVLARDHVSHLDSDVAAVLEIVASGAPAECERQFRAETIVEGSQVNA
jgi:hypothetical protein